MLVHVHWSGQNIVRDVVANCKLPTPIQLRADEEYEIAVLEAGITSRVYNVPEYRWIRLIYQGSLQTVELPPQHYPNVDAMNYELKQLFKDTNIPQRVLNVAGSGRGVTLGQYVLARWTIGEGLTIEMPNDLRFALGIPFHYEGHEIIVRPDLFRNFRYIFLQSNLISADQYFRNSKAGMLGSIPMDYSKALCSKVFEKPIYHKVNSHWLEEIEIVFCDEIGRKVMMKEGTAYALLDIRPIVKE